LSFYRVKIESKQLKTSKYLPKIGTFDGAGFWKKAFAHQRGNLLRAVKVPDDQIKILVNKSYPELPAALRYEIETSGIKEADLK
jgi:hypothetical protein